MLSKIMKKLSPFRPIYLPVDSEGPSEPHLYLSLPHYVRSRRSRVLELIGSTLIPILCLFVGLLLGYRWSNIQGKCMLQEEGFSPFLADSPSAFTTKDTHFDARLHHPTMYGAPPSAEVDQLWYNLSVGWKTIYVSESDGLKAGLQGSVLVNHTHKDGTSSMDYFATVDAFHQLHCLDLLRKASHPNYEYYAKRGEPMFKDNELYELQTHLGHCTDILRQGITCKPDYSLLGYVYVEGMDFPVPNFPGTTHKCRDFDALREWTAARAVESLTPKDLVSRDDARVVVMPEVP